MLRRDRKSTSTMRIPSQADPPTQALWPCGGASPCNDKVSFAESDFGGRLVRPQHMGHLTSRFRRRSRCQ